MKNINYDKKQKFTYSFTNTKIEKMLKWLSKNNSISTLDILFGDKINFFHKYKSDLQKSV